MAIHDYVISNQGFPAFRSDLNDVLQAIVSNNSNATAPSTTYAYQMWYETDTNNWYMRNADNDAWITLATFNQTNDTVNFIDSSATVAGISTSASATVITLANGVVALNPAGYVSVGGAATQSGEIRFLEDTDNGANYIAVKSPTANVAGANFTLTLPEATDTLIGKATTDTLTNKTLTSPKINEDVAVTSTATELNKLDAVSRGSIIYGNSSAATAILTKGSANTVLTSDGTDIAWAEASGGGTSWQAVVTASTLTTVAGRGYFINTTSNACTVTLPGSASIGDTIQIVDYAGKFATNNITLTSSLDIEGSTDDKSLTTNREGVTITYVDATQGWVATSAVNSGDQAIGPVLTTVDFLAIGGGGGGSGDAGAGGSGAGGYRNSYSTENSGGGGSSETSLSLASGTQYTVTIGAGGTASGSDSGLGGQGGDTSISGSGLTTLTSVGGGVGGSGGGGNDAGTSGGCGGGADNGTGASGTANQGFKGGNSPGGDSSGGGGGVGAVGVSSPGSNVAGAGGAGLSSSITASAVTRGGGGGAATYNGSQASGGSGGGGDGGTQTPVRQGGSGTANTGGGAGGKFSTAPHNVGGSGVVILRMLTSKYSGTTSGSPSVSTSGSDTILIFNGSGSYTA